MFCKHFIVTYNEHVTHFTHFTVTYDDPTIIDPVNDFESLLSDDARYHNINCPVDPKHVSIGVAGAIEHLNDFHYWTFDEIADWLDTLNVDLTVREQC